MPNLLLPGNENGIPIGNVDNQWPSTEIANLVVNPVNDDDMLVSSTTGNVFESTNQGVTWFQIGTPAIFGSPANTSVALTFGAPDPYAPEGLGNLGNFVYVGTSPTASGSKGQVFVSRDAGGTWANISLGLDGSPVQEIITDPARGSYDAYAVTTTGVFYLPNSILLAENPTVTQYEWQNITGNLKARLIRSSARSTTRRTTPAPCPTISPRSSTRSRPTGTTPSPMIPRTSPRDITRCSTSPPTRASTC